MEKINYPYVNKSVFYGVLDKNLKKLENRLGVSLAIRGDSLLIDGPTQKVEFAKQYFDKIRELEQRGLEMKEEDFHIFLDMLEGGGDTRTLENYAPPEPLNLSRKSVTPKSLNQHEYIQAIKTHDLVFGIGPAGTGKTYLAMAMALSVLQDKLVSRIVLTRPAVEAGEKLGFLPGTMAEKVNPYLRPLYDALHDMMDADRAAQLVEQGTVEVAPLAFMRGRTLNDAFVILDEAQNTTVEQMKMFLTRLGFHSKAVVTGDVTQVDLPQGRPSGLSHARRILDGVEGISFCTYSEVDVVRHPLVQEVIRAYERADAETKAAEAGRVEPSPLPVPPDAKPT